MQASQERVLPRIGLVATDAMRVAGLQAILSAEAYEVALLSTPSELGNYVELVLIDASATENLFELLGTFRRSRPGVRVIVLGEENDFEFIERVIGAGAMGYLNHAVDEDELRTAIGVVQDGSVWAPRRVLARLLAGSLRGPVGGGPLTVRLTKREEEVLKLLIRGQPNREIASALGVDEGTIKAHMGRLMRKAGVDNRTALSMRAIERRWT